MYQLLSHSEAMYVLPKYVTGKRHIIQILPKVQTTNAHAILFAFSFSHFWIPRSHSSTPPSNYFPPYVHTTKISYFLIALPPFYMHSILILQFPIYEHLKN
jgi:hypothetical protein